MTTTVVCLSTATAELLVLAGPEAPGPYPPDPTVLAPQQFSLIGTDAGFSR